MQLFFKTGAGRTKHILSAYPMISSPPPEQHMDINMPDVLLQELENQYNGEDSPPPLPDDKELDYGHSHDHHADVPRSSPPPDVDTEFFGHGNYFFTTITQNSMVCLISLINLAADMTYRTSM